MADKKKSKNASALNDTDSAGSKLPSMKTATDVISRLQWDESLPQDKFIVGYLDRFDGIVEKPFTALDWRDPAIVDNYTLALPKHRIQYFKYLTRKVWDKRSRTDIIFGSTGYPLSIHDFIARVDNDILNFNDECLSAEYTAKPSEHSTALDCLEEVHGEEDVDMIGRPNFFIAARIDNVSTVANLKEVSDYIKSKDDVLGECCVKPEMLHLTFSILKLDSPSDVSNAILALESLAAKNLSPVILNLEGLDNFKYRVLYSRVEENEQLMEVRKSLVDELSQREVCITDKYSFVPHVTVAKLSRTASRLRHSKYIDQYLYLKFEDDEFGTQAINKLYLCEMGDARREDGFYKCAYEVDLHSK